MTIKLIILSAIVVSQLQGNFNFGGSNENCEGGSGTFEQQINHYGGDYENAITVGTIYKDLKDVYITLYSDRDVDIKPWHNDEWETNKCTSLPCTINKNSASYYIIKVKTAPNTIAYGSYLRTQCMY